MLEPEESLLIRETFDSGRMFVVVDDGSGPLSNVICLEVKE
jgi:hypothetical protein